MIMKILNLTKFYYPMLGGMETVVKNITDSNLKNGYVSDIICSNSKFGSTTSYVDGSKIYRLSKWLTLKSTSICPSMPWKLSRIYKDYDLLHVHFPDPMAALSLYISRPSIPFIIHWHSDIIKQQKFMPFFEPLQRWCLDNAKCIIVTSPPYFESSLYLAHYKNKIKVVPIGISSDANKKEKKISKKKIVLSVGRLTSYKGFENLIRATKLLPIEYSVKIVGDGELRNSLSQLISDLDLEDRVLLLGKKSDSELNSLYEEADLFCLPSTQKSEAFGVVLLEAMSQSLPIVACDIEGSGVPWVNQNGTTGINVTPNNPSELASAITKIMTSNNYHQFSKNSYERYISHFQLKNMMEGIWSIYKKALKL